MISSIPPNAASLTHGTGERKLVDNNNKGIDGMCDQRETKITFCESFGVGVQYLVDLPVKKGQIAEVSFKRNARQVYFESSPHQTPPLHAYVPVSHYDMLNDTNRNDAYEKAIKCAVERKKAEKGTCEVLDTGVRSGILSMFAARASADYIHAVEQY